LLKSNNRVIGIHDTNRKRQRQAVKLLGISNNPDYAELVERSEVLLIATPDDVITEAYEKMQDYISETKYLFHFSGVLTADIIPKKRNVYRASVHPFATFPVTTVATVRRHFFLSIEGDTQAIRVARMMFRKKYFTLHKIKKEQKPTYHLVGVFSSNLLIGLVVSINELADKIGWRRKELEQMVIPMLEETIHNVRDLGTGRSLTGPLSRGDARVIKKHLTALKKERILLDVYKSLSRMIVDKLIAGRRKRELKRILR